MQVHHFAVLLLIAGGATENTAIADEKTPTPPQGTAYVEYPDMPRGHWAFNAMNRASAFGIIEGYPDGLLRGDQPLKRYEFPVLLSRILNTGCGPAPTSKFRWKSLDDLEKGRLFPPARSADVPRNHYAFEAVQLVQRLGIMQGNPQNQFLGDKAMTRYEATIAVHRLMQLRLFEMVPVTQ